MKYLKTYEQIIEDNPIYWKIPTNRPDFILALKKIDMLDKDIEYFNSKIPEPEKWHHYVYIIRRLNDFTPNFNDHFYPGINPNKYFWTYTYMESSVEDFKNMGTINIEDYERQVNKFNL